MAQQHVLMGAESNRVRPTVRIIGLRDLKDALARGIADFSAMPTHAVFLCLIYPIVGLLLARLTLGYELLPLLFPLAAGFAAGRFRFRLRLSFGKGCGLPMDGATRFFQIPF